MEGQKKTMKKNIKRFEFSSKPSIGNTPEDQFKGDNFFLVYKNSEFLRCSEHVDTILSKGYQLRKQLKEVNPGEYVEVAGMKLAKGTPLVIKRTGAKIKVENSEFTYNRLSGLTAAYVFQNRTRFPVIKCDEANTLGLKWDHSSQTQCRLYLSAVSGTEHFVKQFSYWPLLCGLRKLQLKKITLEPVVKMAKIKNDDGNTMASVLMKNYENALRLWLFFANGYASDLINTMDTVPQELKKLFVKPI